MMTEFAFLRESLINYALSEYLEDLFLSANTSTHLHQTTSFASYIYII